MQIERCGLHINSRALILQVPVDVRLWIFFLNVAAFTSKSIHVCMCIVKCFHDRFWFRISNVLRLKIKFIQCDTYGFSYTYLSLFLQYG